MILLKRLTGCMVLLSIMLMTSGCQVTSRYMTNRYYDFRDTWALGAGVTAENPVTGIIPPSLGLHVEVTDWLKLGAITHNGLTAHSGLRGSYIGPNSYTKLGFLWWQSIRIHEDYETGKYNYFKRADTPWAYRMESLGMSFAGRPAKRLHYDYWENYRHSGVGLLHRGWQYWGYSGVELAISEPFITHLGFMVKAGIDVSEIMDFVLGWAMIDFKHDDLRPDEYRHFLNEEAVTEEMVMEPGGPIGDRITELAPIPEMLTIYFDYDRSNIRADQVDEMNHNLQHLLANPELNVLVEGHCDERGTTEYNFALGLRRANSVRDWLVQGGVDPSRINVQSFGEEQPAQAGHTEDAWKWNRRSEFKRIVTMTVY